MFFLIECISGLEPETKLFACSGVQLIKTEVAGMHGTSGLVAMTSASHAEGRQFDPGLVYILNPGAAFGAWRHISSIQYRAKIQTLGKLHPKVCRS